MSAAMLNLRGETERTAGGSPGRTQTVEVEVEERFKKSSLVPLMDGGFLIDFSVSVLYLRFNV